MTVGFCRLHLIIACAVGALFASIPLTGACTQAEEAARKIQHAYEGIRTVRGQFIQKSHVRDLKRTDTYRGEFVLKAQKMRWEYTGDKPQIIYISGDDITIYQKREKQAFRAKFDRGTYGQAPVALLGGFGRITEEFEVSMKGERLLLTPKKPMGTVLRVEVTVSEGQFPIESLTVIDQHANTVEIRLKNVKTNTEVQDKTFEFVPPADVTVLQQQ